MSVRGVWEIDLRYGLDATTVHVTEKVIAASSGRAVSKALEFHPESERERLTATRVQLVTVTA